MSSKPASALAALLVSNDEVISEQISGLLRKLAASTLVSNDLQTALRLLSTRKFEAIVVDLQLGESGLAVLEKVRASPSNRTTVVFAISGSLEDTKKAFEAGSNFVIDRPIVTVGGGADVQSRIFPDRARAASILSLPNTGFCPSPSRGGDEIKCRAINISEGGMALGDVPRLTTGIKVSVRFKLPDRGPELTLEAEVCWYDSEGRAEVQFLSIPDDASYALKEWLAQRLEEMLPESVAAQFRNSENHDS